MVTFAIDRIPSLADRMPYASYLVLHGDESDGVPLPIEDENTGSTPPLIGELVRFDDTLPMRKAKS